MKFVTQKDNLLSLEVIEALERKRCKTLVLWTDDLAPEESLALFDIDSANGELGSAGSHLRLASHRLLNVAPSWTDKSMYLVGVRKFAFDSNEAKDESLDRLIAFSQVDPKKINLLQRAPWGRVPEESANQEMYFTWIREKVGIDPEELRLMSSVV